MTAIDNLEAAVVVLTASVDAAVAKLSQPPAPQDEARVQAASDAVSAQAARLDAASGS